MNSIIKETKISHIFTIFEENMLYLPILLNYYLFQYSSTLLNKSVDIQMAIILIKFITHLSLLPIFTKIFPFVFVRLITFT